LNLRPLGYEPNELPDCSTPQHYRSVGGAQGQILVRDSLFGGEVFSEALCVQGIDV
jgi:hypothetical protein